MPLFRNPTTGAVGNYEGDAALAAARAGYQPVGGGSVDVYTPAGRHTAVDAADLGEFEQSLPVVGVDPGEIEREKYGRLEEERFQDEYGGAGSQVAAFGEGALDALSLGGYGALNEALGGEYEERATANPRAHVGGEVTGLLGAVLVPGAGEAAAGRAGLAGKALAATPAGYTSAKAAKLAEAIGGLKGAAAGQALEGAVYATGQTLSQAYIKDEKLTASALYGEVGRNALFGAGLGASGAVLAKSLAKVGGRLDDVGRGGAATPLVDLGAKEARKAVNAAAHPMGHVEGVADDVLDVLEGRPPKGARVPTVDEGSIPKGPVTAGDAATEAESALAQQMAQEAGNTAEAAAGAAQAAKVEELATKGQPSLAQRHKVLKSVGDQVSDYGVELKLLDPADMRRLKKAYANMDEAVTFAKESGKVNAANKAFDAYEAEVSTLAKKVGMDVEEQLVRARVPKATEVAPAVSKAADDVVPPAPAPVKAAAAVDNAANVAAAASIRATRKLAKQALGLKDNMPLTGDSLRGLLLKDPDEIFNGLSRLDDYFTELRKGVELTGDSRAAWRVEKSLDTFSNSIGDLTGGTKLTDLDRSVIATSLNSEALAAAKFNTPAVERLHELAALSKVTSAKLPKGVTRKGLLKGGLITSAASRAAARGASRVGNQLGGGGLGGALLGGGAAATAFHVIRSLGGLTGAVGGRIAHAVGKVSKAGAKLQRPATLTAAWLIRETRWGFDPEGIKAPSAATLREAFRHRAEELSKIAAAPDAAQLKIHNELAPLRKHAPGVADELEMLAISVPQYLYDKMPKDPGVAMRWGKSNWAPSDYEIRRWGEHVRGAVAPVETFEEMMESGFITPQAAEAVRTLHPELFNQMQQEVFQRADELRDKLDHGGQVRISLFFQVPVTSTMRPEFRAFMKERHALKAQTQAPTGAKNLGTSSGGVDAVEPYTGAQQLLKQ